MKKMFFLALLTVAFGSASFSRELIAEGKTYSALGDYRIEIADNPVILNGDVIRSFVISYQNTPLEVKVAIRKEKDCKKYIVLSDKLCIQYVSNANYFGVERLDKSFEKDGYSTSDTFLDRNEYFHQKVLTSGPSSEIDNTRLIASYFPLLLKKNAAPVALK
jgi:hypothetical protein